jgi:hypothetical protein
MVYSPIPFTPSFCDEVKARIIKERLSETAIAEKELSERCEEAYRVWSEEKLKGCPQFMRKFTSDISVVTTSTNTGYWGGRGISARYLNFKTKQRVCMVPGFVDDDSMPSQAQIDQNHPLFAQFIELEKLRKRLDIRVSNQKHREDSHQKNSKAFSLYCSCPDYDDILNNMALKYADNTKEELNSFVLEAVKQAEKVVATEGVVTEETATEEPVESVAEVAEVVETVEEITIEEPVTEAIEETPAEGPTAETTEAPAEENAGENTSPSDWPEKETGVWTQLELF